MFDCENILLSQQILGREEFLSSVQMPKMSKDLDEQLKLTHKVYDVLDRTNRRL